MWEVGKGGGGGGVRGRTRRKKEKGGGVKVTYPLPDAPRRKREREFGADGGDGAGEAGLGIDGREGEGRGGDAVEGGRDAFVEAWWRWGLAVVGVRGEGGWSWVGGCGGGLEDREDEEEEIDWRNGRDHFLWELNRLSCGFLRVWLKRSDFMRFHNRRNMRRVGLISGYGIMVLYN